MEIGYLLYKAVIPFKENPSVLVSFIFLITISIIFWYYINNAKMGKIKEIFIRRIPALNSIDEAVGRSTELGKPILYIPGIMDIDNIQTLASLSLLSYIAQKTALYETELIMPVSRSVVMTVAQEVIKESYLKVGRSDLYRADKIFYLTDDQFGYAAAVDGIISREKPGAIFLVGAFYAESLILAETGFSAGAIQIAGTAMITQLPFFIAACDYVLIGEELFAASAYLSSDIIDKITLKTQDISKAIVMSFILFTAIFNNLLVSFPNLANLPVFNIINLIIKTFFTNK
ncbi:MAG: hypothetical protein N2485_05995 [bacterium]|nr:hypothetical protein [bacterium]